MSPKLNSLKLGSDKTLGETPPMNKVNVKK